MSALGSHDIFSKYKPKSHSFNRLRILVSPEEYSVVWVYVLVCFFLPYVTQLNLVEIMGGKTLMRCNKDYYQNCRHLLQLENLFHICLMSS